MGLTKLKWILFFKLIIALTIISETSNSNSRERIPRHLVNMTQGQGLDANLFGHLRGANGEPKFDSPIEPRQCKLQGRTFGCFKHPIRDKVRYHKGIDLAAPRGTPVKVPTDGCSVVEFGDKGDGHGKKVTLKCGKYTLDFCHLNSYGSIRKGMTVNRGMMIGKVGSTGLSTGPHLHFEVKVDKMNINPLAFFEKPKSLCESTGPSRNRYDDSMCHDGNRMHYARESEQRMSPRSSRR